MVADRRRNLDVFRVARGDEVVLVISWSGARLDLGVLTEAERAVACDAVRGLSNLQIAKRRNRAPRTVANQLASAFRKLGVSSRADLIARYAQDDSE
jgi:DNA-binding NarL/FixJ family response regulator